MGERRFLDIALSAAVFILLEVIALIVLSKTSPMQNIWFLRMSHRTSSILWRAGESVRSFASLKIQNEDLAERNLELSRELLRYQIAEAHRVSVDEVHYTGFDFIHARIVKMSRSYQHNYLVLDRGYEDGVTLHSGIVGPKGVVGVVEAVGKHFSYGMTLMNTSIGVSARIGHEGYACTLRWDGIHSDGAYVEGLSHTGLVSPGDTVRTSGLSSLFPEGIPLGIADEPKLGSGASAVVPVKLFQDFKALRHVMILCNLDSDRIKEVERQAEVPKK